MIGKLITSAALVATVATSAIPAAATARDHDRYGYSDGRDYDRGGRDYDRGYDRGRHHGEYRRGYRGNYAYNDGYYRRDRHYYGRQDYRYRCRDRGTGGTIIGAIAGGLLGNSVAGYGDRGLGTVLGAGGGALIGRSIDRNC